MAQLKDPQKAIPGGYTFYVAQTKWRPAPFSSLDSIAQQLLAHRRGRPDLVAQNGWSLDLTTIRQEVEAYNVAVCVRNGWSDYIIGGGEVQPPFPPFQPSLLQKLGNVAAGRTTIVRWQEEGSPTVTAELATHRASVCSGGESGERCPQNGKGGLETYFTVPAANAVRRETERKKQMKMETPFDDKLGVCEACTCPLIVKPWMPLASILRGLKPEQKAALDPRCWILSEEKALTETKDIKQP